MDAARNGEKFEMKTHDLGPESGITDEIQTLNRTLRWTTEAEIVIKDMNMKKANAVFSPAVPEPSEEANIRLSSLS